MAKDDLLPKKRPAAKPTESKASSSSKGSGPSPQMVRLMRITRGIGIVLGGIVCLVAMMGLVGFATDNFWARFLVGIVVVVIVPALAADRLLKRTKMGGGLGLVGDVFAILLLGVALLLVSVDFISKPLFVREGDRYARSGSRGMARLAYYFGGVSPVFPEDKGEKPAASGSASGSAPPRASGSNGSR